MAPPAFPFSSFLELLRGRGIPIGVHDYARLAKLLSRWDGLDTHALGIAFGALLGRNREECAQIVELFETTYVPGPIPEQPLLAPKGAMPTAEAAPPPGNARQGGPPWLLLSLCAILSLSIVAWLHLQSYTFPGNRPDLGTSSRLIPPPSWSENSSTLVKKVPGSARRVPLASGLAILFAAAGAALLGSYAFRRRAYLRGRLEQIFAYELSSPMPVLPGPSHYSLSPRYLHPQPSGRAIAEVTRLLGSEHTTRTRLNMQASLEASLKSAAFLQVVYEESTPPGVLLVLVDESAEMAPWKYKVAMLLDALQARGVAVQIWSFDAEASVVRSRADGRTLRLAELHSRTSSMPLWILSVGGGLSAPDGTLRPWVYTLASWKSRAFLTPICLQSLWPESLSQLPMACYPLNESGLLQAALAVAEGDVKKNVPRRPLPQSENEPTEEDCERLRRLLCLLPDPDVYYAFALRLRFLPQVNEEVVLYLLAEQPRTEGVRLGQSPALQEQLLRELRAEDPSLELEARGFLLKVLQDAEPQPGTLAHMRWRLAHAQHKLFLAPTSDASIPFIRELEVLRDGPLQTEAEAALKRALGRQLHFSLHARSTPATAFRKAPTALGRQMLPFLSRWKGRLWPAPRAREFVVAAVAGLAVYIVLRAVGGSRVTVVDLNDLGNSGAAVEHHYADGAASPLDMAGPLYVEAPSMDAGAEPWPPGLRVSSPRRPDMGVTNALVESHPNPLWPPPQKYSGRSRFVSFSYIIDRKGERSYRYAVSETEITQRLFSDVMGYNPSAFKGPQLPVENVSWLDAIRFANKLSMLENVRPCYAVRGESVSWPEGVECRGYRIPTYGEWRIADCELDRHWLVDRPLDIPESSFCMMTYHPAYREWISMYEYLRRDPLRTFRPPEFGEIAWFDGNSQKRPHPVAEKLPNSRRLFDMRGNVAEWLWDTPSALDAEKTRIAPPASWRLTIGGSFRSSEAVLKSVQASPALAKYTSPAIGIRIVRTVSVERAQPPVH